MAKFVVAGRILSDSKCDHRRLDSSAVYDLAATASRGIAKKEWLARGRGDGLSFGYEAGWREALYFDPAIFEIAMPSCRVGPS